MSWPASASAWASRSGSAISSSVPSTSVRSRRAHAAARAPGAAPASAAASAAWSVPRNPCRPPSGSPAGQPTRPLHPVDRSPGDGRLGARPDAAALELRAQACGPVGEVRGKLDPATGQRDDVEPGAERRAPRPASAVGVGPQVDQRGQHVAVPRREPVQRGDRVQRGAAGAQLVVDQHQRPVPAQQLGIGRAAAGGRWRASASSVNPPAVGEIRRSAAGSSAGSRRRRGLRPTHVPERRGRLGEPEHQRVPRNRVARRVPRNACSSTVRRAGPRPPRRAAARPAAAAAGGRPTRPRPARRAAARPPAPAADRWARACPAPATPAAGRAAGCAAGPGRAARPRRPSTRTPSRSHHRAAARAGRRVPVTGTGSRRAGRRTRRPRRPRRTPGPAACVRRAQAVCGRISFILLRWPGGEHPAGPAGAAARRWRRGAPRGHHRQRVDHGHVARVDGGLALQPVRLVQLNLADQPVDRPRHQLAAQLGLVVLGRTATPAAGCGRCARPPPKYSQTGPVTVNPVPSARPSTLTTSAITR